jgi:membrane protease YdiL (CAAX protease family)
MTGDWIAVADPGDQPLPAMDPTPADAPDAAKKGTTSYILWTILLWIDLGLLALNFLAVLVAGAILVFSPSSSAADSVRQALEGETNLYLEVLIAFIGFGLIPLLWVLGTRRVPIEGTKRFLHLHDPGKGILRGVLLTLPILLAVALLIIVYTVATEGVEGLTQSDPDANPAVQKILENLTWPLVVLIALGAGIGEEIFFRGLLQRYLGVWGQGVLFGLAHSAGGYVPQIAVAFGIGILFGYLVKRGWSLWTMITAHVLYDFTLLSMALLFPEAA